MATTKWHEGELDVQRRAGVTDHHKLRNGVRDALPPHFCTFLEVQRFIVAATRDPDGRLWCSMVTGWPGFASAVTPQRVALDRRAFADQTVLRHLEIDPRVGLLALDPSTRRRIRINGTASVDATTVTVEIGETFGNCRQYIQQRPAAGPEPQASELVTIQNTLGAEHRDWIGRADTCFVASIHDVAGLDASHRGGHPGFIDVLNDRALAFDDYPGNDMFQTLGNMTANPATAMLFVDFERGATLQLSGQAVVQWETTRSPTGRRVEFTTHVLIEKRLTTPWRWPVLEYSPVNP